jgi:hypothetical protein
MIDYISATALAIKERVRQSMCYQCGLSLGYTMDDMDDQDSKESEHVREILDYYDLHAEVLTENCLRALVQVLLVPETKDGIIKQTAAALWEMLGDPDSNGETPPDIYHRTASRMMHGYLLLINRPFTDAFTS